MRLPEIRKYVLDTARLMSLGHWEIHVQVGGLEDPTQNMAEVKPIDQMYVARIRFAPDLFQRTRSVIRYYVVHELLHCHHRDLENTINSLSDQFSPAMWEQIYDRFDKAEELATDLIAAAWAKRLPLPPVAKRRRR